MKQDRRSFFKSFSGLFAGAIIAPFVAKKAWEEQQELDGISEDVFSQSSGKVFHIEYPNDTIEKGGLTDNYITSASVPPYLTDDWFDDGGGSEWVRTQEDWEKYIANKNKKDKK